MWNGVIDEWIDEAKKRINALNREISSTDSLSDAFHIGPAYFLKLKECGSFEQLWTLHIEPLLKEYLRGTVEPAKDLKRFKKAYELDQAEKNGEGAEQTPDESEG